MRWGYGYAGQNKHNGWVSPLRDFVNSTTASSFLTLHPPPTSSMACLHSTPDIPRNHCRLQRPLPSIAPSILPFPGYHRPSSNTTRPYQHSFLSHRHWHYPLSFFSPRIYLAGWVTPLPVYSTDGVTSLASLIYHSLLTPSHSISLPAYHSLSSNTAQAVLVTFIFPCA